MDKQKSRKAGQLREKRGGEGKLRTGDVRTRGHRREEPENQGHMAKMMRTQYNLEKGNTKGREKRKFQEMCSEV